MKTKGFVLLSCLLVFAAGLQAQTVKGDGNVITRTISITDYDKIMISGSMTFEYEQSSGAPFLSITTDKNIFEYIEAKVEGHKLIIGYKKSGRRNEGYSPTTYKVKSNSKELKDLSKSGSGDFIVRSALRLEELDINSAGSGDIEFAKEVNGKEMKINLAGSGSMLTKGDVALDEMNINLAGSGKISVGKLRVESLSCNVAGSGRAQIDGRADKARFSVAGSGSVKGFELKASQVNASVTGSGSIELFAEEELTASSYGSGNISYRGAPHSINKESGGSGSIRQVN
ncbi:MAG: DUF2807 domain-containing protein [Tannerellaceae bacterium]|jgi:hypothetical protein|nr:DUF2807 domain-containing protein [Tannerellaceae bacterium]